MGSHEASILTILADTILHLLQICALPVLGPLHRIHLLPRPAHATRLAEPDVQHLLAVYDFRPAGAADHAALRHAALALRGP